jgi:3-phenylpropionate/cinnamic acid dioxygenase small subunit
MSDTATFTGSVVSQDIYLEVLQFLYHEADLLDSGQFDDWLGLLAEDLEYEMPLTVTRERSEKRRMYNETMEYFAESFESLSMRVARLNTEYAWAEDPPTRTRHLVSNVQVLPGADANEVEARSAFCVFGNRGKSTHYDLYVGSRVDVLRRSDAGWKLQKRKIFLDQATLGSHSISIFL